MSARSMFRREEWFAWFPVTVQTRAGPRIAWLETIMRECSRTEKGATAWRYYA